MAEIMHTPTVEIEQLNAKGQVIHKTRIRNDKVRLQAIRELNRMDGTYERVGIVNRAAQKALEPLLKEWSVKLREGLK